MCVGESVEFEHRETGLTLSTAAILAGDSTGWTEVDMPMVTVDPWNALYMPIYAYMPICL